MLVLYRTLFPAEAQFAEVGEEVSCFSCATRPSAAVALKPLTGFEPQTTFDPLTRVEPHTNPESSSSAPPRELLCPPSEP